MQVQAARRICQLANTIEFLVCKCERWLSQCHWPLILIPQGIHVDDETDASITQNRSAGDCGYVAVSASERLDHDLLLPYQLIDRNAVKLIAPFRDDQDAAGA